MPADANWTQQRERGSIWAIKAAVWLALHLGRTPMRALLYPICLYFMLAPSHWQRASRDYLPRALGRKPVFADGWRHCLCFARCLLDRVYLLNGRTSQFDVQLHGGPEIDRLRAGNTGLLLFGAHLGSFEVTRAIGHAVCTAPISLVMYEDNARKTGAVLGAINPSLNLEIIALGRPQAMLAVRDRLTDGHLVGVLPDRSISAEKRVKIDFLGAPAWFPEGPFRMAALLGHPVVFMLGLYRGGARYDVVFEDLGDPSNVAATMRRYVALLERHCLEAPYNWFNFYDFWA
jgi:predicted LPLAT superfamily acyltransferase